jgi:hypothetical protein
MASVLAVVLGVLLLTVGQDTAQAGKPETPPKPVSAFEDSLRHELRLRQERLLQLKDQVHSQSDPDLTEALAGLEVLVRDLETELSSIKIEVQENAVLFSNPSGDLRITIPEDIGERFSEGLSAITATILGDIPDTVDFHREINKFQQAAEGWSWALGQKNDPEPKRKKIIGSDVFSFDDDIVITADERVQGDVITLFGDAVILGEVDGQVIVVGGELTLGEDALVHDSVSVAFGEMRRDDQSTVSGGVQIFNPGGDEDDLSQLLTGEVGFMVKLAVIFVIALLVMVLFVMVPASRLEIINEALVLKGTRSFVTGVIWLTLGHVLLLVVVIVLVATVIGIPLALLLGLGYILMGLMAIGTVARTLGNRVIPRETSFLPILAGLLLISLPGILGALFQGFIADTAGLGRLLELLGLMVHATAYSFGSGALLISRFGGRR